ncbi:hypothetical protein [Bacillus gaemokensis]|uniref:Uncharacterized protein n=1 Tax=Bacillus gaemokensis TaxID=574375 RepID=A0A073KC12_9BACI|nr:hypothetical protein [Bacillus gaemokensis]KEK23967.1 hypothetical protein BAGA_06035 [Bacillus gaemokensis]KYG38088.1 hypothetical protein AZF08_20265 [Bacillus gaemokensis]
MRDVTPVLAQSLSAFKAYIEEHKLNISHFSYINSGDNLRGYRGLIITVGRWWRNDRYRSIEFYDTINSLVYNGHVSVIQGTWESEDSRMKMKLL